MATDGISFNNPDTYKSLWLHLYGVKMGKFPLKEGLEHFLNNLDLKDDASIGVMYVPAPEFLRATNDQSE